MFENDEPTVIVKSLRELNKFLAKDKSRENSRDEIGGSPRLKLSFTDTSDNGPDNSFFCDLDSSSGSSFVKRHQQNIAGFDITKKIREKDSEILEYKTKVSVLEAKLENLNSSCKQARVQHDTEIDSFRMKQLRDKEKIDVLEEKVKQLVEKDKKGQELAQKNRDASEFHRTQKEKRTLELFNSHVEKIQNLEQKLDAVGNHNSVLENENKEQASILNLQKDEIEILEQRVLALKNQLTEFQNTKLEVELFRTKLNQANAKSRELELRLESLKDQENNFQLFEDTNKQLPVLQKELMKLKEENHFHKLTRVNIDMLKEKLAFAENQVQSFEIKCQDLMAENATLVALRDLNEKYEVIIKKEFQLEYLPPESEFLEIIRNLKKKDADVDHSLSELKASIESHSSSKVSQEELARSLKASLEKSHFEATKNAHIIKRLQRKIFLLSKERDSLKNILVSYQSEATLNPSLIEQERLNHLETQLSDYKSEIIKLEEELDKAQQLTKYEAKSKHDLANEDRKATTGENAHEMEGVIAQLKEENDNLKAQLEHYSNKGIYDPQQTKVIHFLDNPLEKAYKDRRAEYNRLVEENEALKKRVELLEGGETADLTEKVGRKIATNETSSKHVKELEEKLNTLETRNKRLIDAFKDKSHEMREIMYRLTGYRMDIREDNHYKLSNMYSDSRDDFLLFEQAPNGDLQLLETDFSRTLDDLIQTYLRRDHSYPAFLSTITLKLFNRQTIMHSSSDQEEFEGGEEEDEEMMGDEEEDEELVGEEEDEENEEDYEDHGEGPSAKRPRTDMEEDEDEDEEEDEEDDELICLD